MRTKAITYFAAAILIGFAIMMMPKALQTGPPTYQPDLTLFPKAPAENTYGNALSSNDTENMRSVYGLEHPLSLLPFTLILLIGLVAATGVYVSFKKRLA